MPFLYPILYASPCHFPTYSYPSPILSRALSLYNVYFFIYTCATHNTLHVTFLSVPSYLTYFRSRLLLIPPPRRPSSSALITLHSIITLPPVVQYAYMLCLFPYASLYLALLLTYLAFTLSATLYSHGLLHASSSSSSTPSSLLFLRRLKLISPVPSHLDSPSHGHYSEVNFLQW